VGDILTATLPRAIEVPSLGGPPPPPAPAVPPETVAEIKALSSRVEEMRKQMAESLKRNRDLEARLKRLER
jgi:hypothetical protein